MSLGRRKSCGRPHCATSALFAAAAPSTGGRGWTTIRPGHKLDALGVLDTGGIETRFLECIKSALNKKGRHTYPKLCHMQLARHNLDADAAWPELRGDQHDGKALQTSLSSHRAPNTTMWHMHLAKHLLNIVLVLQTLGVTSETATLCEPLPELSEG